MPPRHPSADLGTIEGVVTADAPQGFFLDAPHDMGGVGVRGVAVIATSPALAKPIAAVTDSAGGFTLAELPPGSYQLAFRSSAGPEVRRNDVEVHPNHTTIVVITVQIPETIDRPCVYFGTCGI